MKINNFVFYRSYFDAVRFLSEEEQLHIYQSIFLYVFDKKSQNLNEMEKAIFTLMKPIIDNSLKRYKSSVENGKKGGAPKGNKNAQKIEKQPKSTQIQPKNNLNLTEKQAKNNLNKNIDKDKDIDKDIKKEINKEKENNIKTIDLVLTKIENITLRENLQEFVKSRTALKKPLTTYALELAISNLNTISQNVDEQIEIVKRTIANGWLDFYPLDKNKSNDKQGFIHNNYTKEQIANVMTDLDNVEL